MDIGQATKMPIRLAVAAISNEKQVPNSGDPELGKLDDIVAAIEACGPNDTGRLQDLDFEFHHTLARASENQVARPPKL